MALIKCKECGHEVSSKADRCPNCGVKLKSKLHNFILIVCIIFSVLWLISKLPNDESGINSINNNSSIVSPKTPASAPKTTTEKKPSIDQTKRLSKLEFISVSYRITEQNDTWWKFAWLFKIKNNTPSPQPFSVDIKFHDADGFVVDDDTIYNLGINANSEEIYSDYILITADVAPNVEKISVRER